MVVGFQRLSDGGGAWYKIYTVIRMPLPVEIYVASVPERTKSKEEFRFAAGRERKKKETWLLPSQQTKRGDRLLFCFLCFVHPKHPFFVHPLLSLVPSQF